MPGSDVLNINIIVFNDMILPPDPFHAHLFLGFNGVINFNLQGPNAKFAGPNGQDGIKFSDPNAPYTNPTFSDTVITFEADNARPDGTDPGVEFHYTVAVDINGQMVIRDDPTVENDSPPHLSA
jgi:hypothetical protein